MRRLNIPCFDFVKFLFVVFLLLPFITRIFHIVVHVQFSAVYLRVIL